LQRPLKAAGGFVSPAHPLTTRQALEGSRGESGGSCSTTQESTQAALSRGLLQAIVNLKWIKRASISL